MPQVSHKVTLACPICDGTFQRKRAHAHLAVYCSKACMGKGFKTALCGDKNPNWRGAELARLCLKCGAEFNTRNPARKYCSRRCADLAKVKVKEPKPAAQRARAAFKPPITLTCAECGVEYLRKASAQPSKFCSHACKGKAQTKITGPQHPNWKPPSKVCEWCRGLYKNASKKSRFCSRHCLYVWEGANGEVDELGRRFGSRTDRNQKEIVAALEKAGVCVIDTSAMRRGVPDLLASTKTKTAFLEVKNPEWAYGRAGLNKFQQAFADGWEGCLYVVRSAEEALAVFGIGPGECPQDLSAFGRLSKADQEKRFEEVVKATPA